MKIIITEQQLNEVLKFNKKGVVSDKFTGLIERLVLDFIDFPICDMVVTKSQDIYMVLILMPKNIFINLDAKIQNYVKKYIPVNVFVIINETECEDFIN